jgi:LPS-assembly protein
MRPLLWAAALALCVGPALAQDVATLVADRVEILGDKVLVAEGDVEVLQRGITLTASRVTFDAARDILSIEGPIMLSDGSGTRVLADQAELSADLRNGHGTGPDRGLVLSGLRGKPRSHLGNPGAKRGA